MGMVSLKSRGFLLASSLREGFHSGYVRTRGILMEDISDLCLHCFLFIYLFYLWGRGGAKGGGYDWSFIFTLWPPYRMWCRLLAMCGASWFLLGSLAGLFEAWRMPSFFGCGWSCGGLFHLLSFGQCKKKEMIGYSREYWWLWRMMCTWCLYI